MQNIRTRIVLIIGLVLAGCVDDPARVTSPELTPSFSAISASDVSTGDDFSCVLRAGVVQCQGLNNSGQAPASKSAATGVFNRVSAGGLHACALRGDGVVECWGDNNFFQAPAVRTATVGYYTALTSGTHYNCALRNDGVIECWGYNTHGQAQPTFTAAASLFTQVSAKREHTCARRSDGVVQCWGQNLSGQAPATRAAAAGTFVQVAVGSNHTCALRSDGKVECWGDNFNGQAPALKTAAVGSFTQITSADLHSCGLRTDGKIECWGVSSWGEAPSLLSASAGHVFTSLSVGTYHACGIWDQGTLQCWGRSNYGEATSDIPAIQSMMRATTVDGPILIFFTDASDEAEFQIERRRRYSDRTLGEWLLLRRSAANITSLYDGLVTEGYEYQYRVRACDEFMTCTPWRISNYIRAAVQSAPAAATSITASVTNPAQIDVAWTHTGNESSFNIQRRVRTYVGLGSWSLVATPAANASSFTDHDVTTGNGYTYRIQACNAIGCSAWMSSTQALNETVPAAPIDITATVLSASSIQLDWDDNSANEATFELQRKSGVGGTWSEYVTIVGTAANDNSHVDAANPATAYRYRVRACNLAGCSTYATSRQVTTP